MRFKVNNKYVVDAKSHDDAIRAIKMLDAMETYSIRWIDTYAKSQGYGPDFWRYDAEIKANNVKEALEKLAKKVALGGTGTANCLVMHVSNSHATYQFSGRLSDLLKKTKEQLGDSVKDAAHTFTIITGMYSASYMRIQELFNKQTWTFQATSFADAGKQADDQFRKLIAKLVNRSTDGQITNNLFGKIWVNSVKIDGKDVPEKLWPSNFIKDWKRASNKSTSAAFTALQISDAEPEADVDLDFLISDEFEAIDGYRKMIAKTSNPQLLSVLSHILDEETEHVEELRAAQAGVYEVEDD